MGGVGEGAACCKSYLPFMMRRCNFTKSLASLVRLFWRSWDILGGRDRDRGGLGLVRGLKK